MPTPDVPPCHLCHLYRRELSTMAAGGAREVYDVPLNPTQAAARRDALAKALDARLSRDGSYWRS